MTDVILWNNTGTSDKLWGVSPYQSTGVLFWGRRTGQLNFKLLSDKEYAKSEKQMQKKLLDDYRVTSFEKLEKFEEGFIDRFNDMRMIAILGDQFRYS